MIKCMGKSLPYKIVESLSNSMCYLVKLGNFLKPKKLWYWIALVSVEIDQKPKALSLYLWINLWSSSKKPCIWPKMVFRFQPTPKIKFSWFWGISVWWWLYKWEFQFQIVFLYMDYFMLLNLSLVWFKICNGSFI